MGKLTAILTVSNMRVLWNDLSTVSGYLSRIAKLAGHVTEFVILDRSDKALAFYVEPAGYPTPRCVYDYADKEFREPGQMVARYEAVPYRKVSGNHFDIDREMLSQLARDLSVDRFRVIELRRYCGQLRAVVTPAI